MFGNLKCIRIWIKPQRMKGISNMNLNLLEEIIKQGESDTLEFKESTSTIENAGRTLSAYLSSDGGRVIIGVRDDGKINGQHVSDQTEKEISRTL